MSIDWSEVRAWAQFLIISIGGVVALRTYIVNQRQRRFENGLRLVAAFRESISPSDLLTWKTVIQESMRPPYTHDVLTDTPGLEYPFGKLLRGDGPDNGAASRILNELNTLSHEFLNGYADLRVFYFELGEVMGSIYSAFRTVDWIQAGYQTRCVLDLFYPTFAKLYRDNQAKFAKWPCRTLIYQ